MKQNRKNMSKMNYNPVMKVSVNTNYAYLLRKAEVKLQMRQERYEEEVAMGMPQFIIDREIELIAKAKEEIAELEKLV